ncbi:hypothetical protein [Cyclobacterium salsum]|uniref:hypothetical protein n=1 Tax=Cyclobacterium salsum TaxID=2666329 RepID=UPI001391051A|nr:hypothetical protein [Cyclobacterium salsum]
MMHFKFNTGKLPYWSAISTILWVLVLFSLGTGIYDWFLHQRHLDWHEQLDFIMLNGLADAVGFFLVWLFLRWMAEKLMNKSIELTVKPLESGEK